MNSTIDCTIQPNPDIIGIGIRISTYILSLAGPLASTLALSQELLDALEGSLGLTGLALFLTTVVSAAQKNLDLFHAICLFHLIALVGVSIRSFGQKKNEDMSVERRAVSLVFYFIVAIGFLVFSIYLFATAPHFGSDSQCNDQVKFVMFGVDIQATNIVFRGIALFTMGLSMLGTILAILFYFKSFNEYTPLEGINLYRVIGAIVGRSYIIAMLELIINRNNLGPGNTTWGFGQLLAMMMLLGPLIQLLSFRNKETSDPFSATTGGDLPLYLVTVILSIIDLGGHAAAGAAAAATGAHVNGSPITPDVLHLGAVAGVLGAGILSFSTLVKATSGFTVGNVLSFMLSTFGMAFVVTTFLAQKVLGEAPDSILIAAIATGAPLLAGNVFQNPADVDTAYSIFSIPFDALAGYTFARVASNHGIASSHPYDSCFILGGDRYDLCAFNAAAAAGAVYGGIIVVWKIPFACYIPALLLAVS
ncbi:MAG: hypothetical protein M1818_003392 [Claussenomyces sp. TS43310]|nr:MAG: hypothetical protein M1818_003392 [Claussenomyces sp. TS43310]